MHTDRLRTLLDVARVSAPSGASIEITGEDPVLDTRFAAGEAAAASLGLAGAAAAHLWELRTGEPQDVRVDVRAAAATLLGFLLQRTSGRIDLSRALSAVTALYEAGDGRWIHLHGGFPHLAEGTVDLLGGAMEPEAVAAAVARWDAFALEEALAERGLCGAAVRSVAEWQAHPQGRALAGLPVVEVERIGDAPPEPLPPGDRPLSGVRVLDLTRVLAGPTCGRTLAGHGADVLRIGAERLPSIEPFVVETGRGKRNAFLDLDRPEDLERLRALARDGDVFCQGYRHGSLEQRGLGADALAALRPGTIHVSIDCYGHAGPWAGRPGWEQLAQSAAGIAQADARNGRPRLIPAAATDYTTGVLAAFGVMTALARRAEEGGSWRVRASLCQTAGWLTRLGPGFDPAAASGFGDVDALRMETETAWGRLTHLAPAEHLSKTPARWALPPAPLGSHAPEWLPREATVR